MIQCHTDDYYIHGVVWILLHAGKLSRLHDYPKKIFFNEIRTFHSALIKITLAPARLIFISQWFPNYRSRPKVGSRSHFLLVATSFVKMFKKCTFSIKFARVGKPFLGPIVWEPLGQRQLPDIFR